MGGAVWTLLLGGDIMLNAVIPGPKVFQSIAPTVKKADIAYANLEIPLTEAKAATSRKSAAEVKARTQFILKASPKHASFLEAAGFDALSLGNNHAMDYRSAGLAQMMGLFQSALLFGAGKDWGSARATQVIEIPKGPQVGFISFLSFNGATAMRKCTPATEKTAGVATLTITGLKDDAARKLVRGIVAAAKKSCDFLVVCLHWGIERQSLPAAYQVRLGRMFVDEGADAVVGNHPHVLQPGERYRGKPILYSLGNLISPTPARAALYTLTLGPTGIQDVVFLPTRVSGGAVTLVDDKGVALRAAIAAQTKLAKAFPTPNDAPLLVPETGAR